VLILIFCSYSIVVIPGFLVAFVIIPGFLVTGVFIYVFLLLLSLFCCFNLEFFACFAFIGHFTLLARARVMIRFMTSKQKKKLQSKKKKSEKAFRRKKYFKGNNY
jgi:hypothetical protein